MFIHVGRSGLQVRKSFTWYFVQSFLRTRLKVCYGSVDFCNQKRFHSFCAGDMSGLQAGQPHTCTPFFFTHAFIMCTEHSFTFAFALKNVWMPLNALKLIKKHIYKGSCSSEMHACILTNEMRLTRSDVLGFTLTKLETHQYLEKLFLWEYLCNPN